MSDLIVPFDRACLFLDLDGTLAPLAPQPGDVGPDKRRNALLSQLARRMGGRVAVISGRTLVEIDRILDGAIICAGGSHGLERRNARLDVTSVTPNAHLPEAIAAARALSLASPGLLVEEKTHGLALHYRHAPELQSVVTEFAGRWAKALEFSIQHGICVVELLTPGADKGDAVRAFMTEMPFHGHTPIFVGDDLTDEHGFEAARALGGFGVLVASRRQSHALARLEDSEAVLTWLENSLTRERFAVEVKAWAA